jgi:DNA-binding transcriptional ArsR family regulator
MGRGRKDFSLPEVSRGGERGARIRETAREFFSEPPADAISPEQSARGAQPSRATASTPERAAAASKLRAVPTPRVDSSPREGRGGRRADPKQRRAAASAKKASWRAPREDGRLRANDKVVLDFLRELLPAGRDTTDELSMKEIARGCDVSHRTAQNTVSRLQQAGMIERFDQELGSNKGCRYRLLGAARNRAGAAGRR